MEGDKATEGKNDAPDKVMLQTAYGAKDIRHKPPADRAKRVTFLRMQLSTLKNDGSKRTEARRKSLLYSLSILDK